MNGSIWLLEASYLDASGSPAVLRAGSSQDFMTRPNDAPPNQSYLPILLTTGIIERHAWAKYTTRGPSQIGWGMPILDNSEGSLDFLKNCTFAGQPLVIRRGPAVQGAYPEDYPAYFTGTMEGAFFPWSQVQLLLRDSLGLFFQRPIQSALYGGTNALPGGFDGVAGDWQGKYKPMLLGTASNFSAPCVNTSKLTYQVHDRSVINVGAIAITAVYDRGVALTLGTNYATIALLQAATTASSHWDWCDDPIYGAFFQLGSSPAGTVTADATSAVNTVGSLLSAILTGPGGIDPALVTGAQALDNLVSGPVGWWVDTTQQLCGDVVKRFTDTCNAYLVDSRDGTWRMGKLAIPTTAPALRFSSYQIKDGANAISVIQGNDLGQDAPATSNSPALSVPVWRVIVNYGFNATVQTETDIAGAGLVRVGYAKQPYRQVSVEDDTVLARNPLAVTLTINTLFVNAADALAEGNAQLAMRRVPPTIITMPLDPSDAVNLDLIIDFGLDVDRLDWPDLAFVAIGTVEDPGDPKTKSVSTIVGWGVPDPNAGTVRAAETYVNPAWSDGIVTPDIPEAIALETSGDVLGETGAGIVTE